MGVGVGVSVGVGISVGADVAVGSRGVDVTAVGVGAGAQPARMRISRRRMVVLAWGERFILLSLDSFVANMPSIGLFPRMCK